MIDEGVARDECWTYCLWLCAVSFSKLFRKGGQVFYCAYFRNRNLGRRIIQMGVASQQVTYALICGLDELWQVLHHDAEGRTTWKPLRWSQVQTTRMEQII